MLLPDVLFEEIEGDGSPIFFRVGAGCKLLLLKGHRGCYG